MSFKQVDYKGLKIEFTEALTSQFSATEIKLIWRESLRHYFAISYSEQLISEDRNFTSNECQLLNQLVNRLKFGEPF